MKSNIYYSVYHCLYDNIDNEDSVLSDIRKKYFETGSEVKNKITKEINSKIYKYSYHLKYGQPLKWKKMYNNILLEKSQPGNNGAYSIVTYGESRRVIKVTYYSWEHEWIKSEYFEINDTKKNPSVILIPDNEYDKIKIYYKKSNCEPKTIEMIRCELPFEKIELYIKNFDVEYLVCDTYDGVLFYCEPSIKNEIINFSDRAINNVEALDSKRTVIPYETISAIEKEENLIDSLNEEIKIDLNLDSEILDHTEKLDCKCEDKYFYIGSIKNSLRNGKGRTAKPNGKTIYEGMYKNGKRDGFGALYYTNDDLCYVGEWKDNKRDGVGVSFNNNQSTIHVGTWENDKLHGIGTKFDKSGNIIFSGVSDNGKINGAGIRYNPESKNYIIEQWDNGVLKNKATEFSPEGKLLYYGEIKDFKRHGYGVQYNDDGGIIYEGYWENNHYNGNGTILYKDHKYTGLFKDSKPYGKGTILMKDGTKIQGIFLNSQMDECDKIKFENNIEYYFIHSV